ncbi:GNAT family N-acetyltransferase [Candidatus Pacearchaeota archaeon]|nr:GNAT family N-acetyltransferase [Candidatus Pacearchaeota archaeon]
MAGIRKATIEDLEDIQKLNLQLFEKEYNEYDKTLNLRWTFGKDGADYFKKRIKDSKNSFTIVVVIDEKIVGYLVGAICKLESYRNVDNSAELENMFVLKEHRNKGIGKELINKFLKWCEEKKVKRIKLVASAQNKKAIELYKNLGFNEHSITLEKEISK